MNDQFALSTGKSLRSTKWLAGIQRNKDKQPIPRGPKDPFACGHHITTWKNIRNHSRLPYSVSWEKASINTYKWFWYVTQITPDLNEPAIFPYCDDKTQLDREQNRAFDRFNGWHLLFHVCTLPNFSNELAVENCNWTKYMLTELQYPSRTTDIFWNGSLQIHVLKSTITEH